jgi:hypothetical protein
VEVDEALEHLRGVDGRQALGKHAELVDHLKERAVLDESVPIPSEPGEQAI